MYPEIGPVVGYAVTCVYGLPDPNFQAGSLSGRNRCVRRDAEADHPGVQQKWPDNLVGKAGFAGGMMVCSMKAVGCVGLISNGPSRVELGTIRKLKFQYMLSGVTAGHGEQAVQAVNVPVSVGGMDVAPGEMIHMDENGAVKFPVEHAEAVVKNAKAMLDDEARRLVISARRKPRPRCGRPVRRRLHAEETLASCASPRLGALGGRSTNVGYGYDAPLAKAGTPVGYPMVNVREIESDDVRGHRKRSLPARHNRRRRIVFSSMVIFLWSTTG